MRLGTVKSELIAKIGHEQGVLRVEYKDGTIFDYIAPFSVFRKLATAKHPGQIWIKIRDLYRHRKVEQSTREK